MIKKVITVTLLLSSLGGLAQIGVGTKSPANSALLDLQSNGPIQRGLLVPRVELEDRFSSAKFGDGIAANSLIVYNTLESEELKIGFYYWDHNEWVLFLTSNNIGEDPDNTVNVSFTLDKGEGDVDSLVITDSAGHIVSLPVADIADNNTFISTLVQNKDFTLKLATNEDFVTNLVTNEYFTTELGNNENFITQLTQNDTFVTEVKSWETITSMTAGLNNDGQKTGEYTYTNETPTDFTFNVVEDVANNLNIISTQAGKNLTSLEKTISINGDKALIANMDIDVNDFSIKPIKLNAKGFKKGDIATVQAIKGDMISDSGTLSTDAVIYATGVAKGALLKDISLGINDNSITSYHLQDYSVEPEKLDANEGANNRFAIADSDGFVTYNPLKSEMISDAGTLSGDEIIKVSNNKKTTLSDVKLSINNKSIPANKLISTEMINGAVATSDKKGNVTYKKVSTETLTDKGNITTDGIVSVSDEGQNKTLSDVELGITDNTITATKLSSLGYKEGTVATAGKKGIVTYEPITPSSITKRAEIKASVENIIRVEGGTNAVLNPVTLSINNKSITARKISSGNIKNKTDVLTSDGIGGAVFVDAMDIGKGIAQADLKGADMSLVITGGDHVLLGKQKDSVTIRINDGGVLHKHIAEGSVTWGKLNGGEGVDNRFAISSKQGVVSYRTITPEVLQNKGNITTDNIIGFGKINNNQTNGKNKTLFDVNLKINDTSIDESKLTSKLTKGYVATVIDGGKVTYKGITSDMIVTRAPVTTDNIILVDGNQTKTDAVLTPIELSIKERGITNKQLADDAVDTRNIKLRAVTIDKLSSEGKESNEDENQILVTDGDGGFKYGTLEDFTPDASNLTTDGIIIFGNDAQGKLTTGSGSVLNPVNLKISDHSLRNYKLSATDKDGNNIADNKILVTDGKGNFEYTSADAAIAGGEDLIISNGLHFFKGSGAMALLDETEIGIADNGVSNAKIAPLAVTTDKISSVISEGNNAPAKSVLTANGQGTVSYQTLQTLMLDEGKPLTSSDNSLTIISKDNKALLETTTIDVAPSGIKNNHIANLAVTSDKISSTLKGNKAGKNTILTADGKGNTSFNAGKPVTSNDENETVEYKGSIEITGGTNAALNPMSLKVRENGILNEHIADFQITSSKIITDKAIGNVLVSIGEGHVEFEDINKYIKIPNYAPITEDAIHADFQDDKNITLPLLAPLTLSLKDLGILNTKLADNEITANKLSSWIMNDNNTSDDSAPKTEAQKNTVLTADGQGFVSYQFIDATDLINKGNLISDETDNIINVKNGKDAVLSQEDVTLSVNDNSISPIKLNSKIAGKTQTSKPTNSEAKTVLTADGNGNVSFKPIEAVDYLLIAKETGEKWIDGSPVLKQVFNIIIDSDGANEITIPQAIPGLIIDARLINNSDNSITRGIISKKISANSTIMKLGIPGFVTNYHTAGTYSLILEYVSPLDKN